MPYWQKEGNDARHLAKPLNIKCLCRTKYICLFLNFGTCIATEIRVVEPQQTVNLVSYENESKLVADIPVTTYQKLNARESCEICET